MCFFRDSRILVFGAGGFKGSMLSAVLHRMGAEVHLVIRHHQHPQSLLTQIDLIEKTPNYYCDLSDYDSIQNVINKVKPDIIINMAAVAQITAAQRSPQTAFSVNVMGPMNIIDACRRLNVRPALLFVSTDHVFGNRDVPPKGFPEDETVSFNGVYDTSKSMMELGIRTYRKQYEDVGKIIITRAANCFGYGDTCERRVIPVFINSALNDGCIRLDCLLNVRQFIYLSDVITGYLKAVFHCCSREAEELSIYHFAIEKYGKTGKPYVTIQQLGEMIAGLTGAKIRKSDAERYAPGENRVQALNCSRTSRELNWRPRISLIDGLRKVIGYYSNPADRSRRIKNEIDETAEILAASC